MKPIIGITLDCEPDPLNERTMGSLPLHWNYALAIAQAGGVPLIIPPMADPEVVAPLLDGWLIPGGDDIDAAHYGQENHRESKLQAEERFSSETELFQVASADLPILGLCYGSQFINVALGGSIDQHLPDKLGHDEHSCGGLQNYQVEPGTLLHSILGEPKAEGKSYHHQAIDQLAPDLKASAFHEDGTIEAIESTTRPWVLGVQWHPERTLHSSDSQKLFKAFIEAARRFKERRP